MTILLHCPDCGGPLVAAEGEALCVDCTTYAVTPVGQLEYVRWQIETLQAEERRLEALVRGLPSQARPSQGD